MLRSLAKVFTFTFIFGLIFYFTLAITGDFDFGSHLSYGEYILTKRAIPTEDFLTYTSFGQPYPSREWLFEVVMFLTFKKFSFLGLTILTSILGFTSFYFLTKIFSSPLFKIVAVIFAGLIVLPIFDQGFRPQLMSILGISFLILSLIKVDKGVRRYALFLPLVFLVWSNTHPTVMMGLLIFGLYWLNALVRIYTGRRNNVRFAFLTAIFTGIIAGAALNFSFPSLIKASLQVGNYVLSPSFFMGQQSSEQISKNYVIEWLPPAFLSFPGSAYFIFILVAGIVFIFWFKKFSFWEIVTIVLFAYMAGASRRHFGSFAFTVIPLVLLKLEENISLAKLPRLGPKVLSTILLMILLPLGFITYQKYLWVFKLIDDEREYARFINQPYGAVAYLRDHPQDGKMFNDYNWGGYLHWKLPEEKVFIDGRIPGTKPFMDYFAVINLKDGWYEVLEKWDVSWVIMPPRFKLVKTLVDEKGWQKVYEDDIAVIVVKPPP